ncbi:scavenger receptor cysteine-rich domain superfamily protein-like [Acanthaster planci]|uniref:Scavenger receptor cysteine-rich domain superfamily protein-like n=1 Tax=Acanthaster planci TaxID=133434 RepID=A0A8B7YTV9_ACAPL|nr:scavenger receptor cysteine-rich domain superfamily protein-like [Acanthaster planci]
MFNLLSVAVSVVLLVCHLLQLCTAERFGNLRLVDGAEPTQGRVEIFEGASWKPICADHWTLEEAKVVCRQLSLPPATEATTWVSVGQSNSTLSQYAFMCSEGSFKYMLLLCISATRYICKDSGRVAGVACGNWANAKQFDIRLAGGVNEYEGRVEIFFNGIWGTVCDSRTLLRPLYTHREEFWDLKDAQVVCKQLGYIGAKRIAVQIQPPPSTLPVIMTNQRCNGTEANLGECNVDYMRRGGPFKCSRSQDVSVVCSDLKVRLVDGDEPTKGRVEIFNGTSWLTICGYQWTLEHAKVVCRELAMPPATGATMGDRFKPGSGGMSANNFACTGTERSIFDCVQTTRDLKCSHLSDAGVICGVWLHAKQFDVRLAGTLNVYEGRVEIYNGVWGTVCNSGSMTGPMHSSQDAFWDIEDAQVVCRQLGYLTARRYAMGRLPETSLPVMMTGTHCKGVEANLGECGVSYSGLHRCSHDQDVSVECDTRPKADRYDTRLVQGSHPNQGYVQVLYMGLWRSVCDQKWGLSSATVVCKQLGFRAAAHAVNGATSENSWGLLEGKNMFLNRVECLGNETNLADCPMSYTSRDSCTDHEQAGVICQSDKYPSILPGDAMEPVNMMIILSFVIPLIAIILVMFALLLMYRRYKMAEQRKSNQVGIELFDTDLFDRPCIHDGLAQRPQNESGFSRRAQRRAQRKTRRQEYRRQRQLERQQVQWSPYTDRGRPPSYDEVYTGPVPQSAEVIDTVSLLPILSGPQRGNQLDQ